MNPPMGKFVGCLLGQCIGDALGFPVEGRDGRVCAAYVERVLRPWLDGIPPEAHEWQGQYTDDSQLARELLNSLVTHRGWQPEDFATRIAEIFRTNRIVGRGNACDAAAARLNDGAAWHEAGEPAPSAGNGTAMRAAPVGLYFWDRPDRRLQVAHEQGLITHHDPRCSAGSVAIAGAVALALSDSDCEPAAFLTTLSEWAGVYHEEFAALIQRLTEYLDAPPDQAVRIIAEAVPSAELADHWPGISPYVVPSVLWSLYAFLRSRDSYARSIATAIAVGGDVDTTAAMTGAISGAYLGVEALPMALAQRIQDRGEWGCTELVALAEDCHGLVVR